MGLGKWIAGALGWAMFGPIGGILGYYFASRVEKLAEATVVYGEDQTWNQGQRNSFLMSLLVLSASVIKADGKTTSQELATLRSFFTRNFGAQAGGEAEEIVREQFSYVAGIILEPLKVELAYTLDFVLLILDIFSQIDTKMTMLPVSSIRNMLSIILICLWPSS